MKLLQRVMMLIRANINDLLEQTEDPDRLLRQLQQDLRNQTMQVKTQIATAIAQEHKLQSRTEELTKEATVWQHKAEAAVARGDDAQARRDLQRRLDTLRLLDGYQHQHEEQQHLIVTMRNALKQLQAKAEEIDLNIELLQMRRRHANMQQAIYETMAKNKHDQPTSRPRKAEEPGANHKPSTAAEARPLPPPGAEEGAPLRRPPAAPPEPAKARRSASQAAAHKRGQRVLPPLEEQINEVLQPRQAKLGGKLESEEASALDDKVSDQEPQQAP
jgi:phage shock protein A